MLFHHHYHYHQSILIIPWHSLSLIFILISTYQCQVVYIGSSVCNKAKTVPSLYRSNCLLVNSNASSSAPHVLFVLLVRFVRWEVSCYTAAVLTSFDLMCSKKHVILLYSFHLFFSLRFISVLVVHQFEWYIYIFSHYIKRKLWYILIYLCTTICTQCNHS